MPAMKEFHVGGTMTLVGDKPILIAGRYLSPTNHGIVEIFDQTTQEWINGPPLLPVRRGHAAVAVNESSVVVIGGYGANSLDSVKILDLDTLIWKDLDNLLTPLEGMVCGLVNFTYLLCVGGRSNNEAKVDACGMDLSLSDPQWERRESLDVDEPITNGFLLQLQDQLFCMSRETSGNVPANKLRRMNLNQTTPTWEVMTVYPDDLFDRVSPFIIEGYHIHP